MRYSEEIEKIKENCAIHKIETVERLNKVYTKTVIWLSVLGSLLWGYFEFRIYPEIVEAKNDVQELRKEVYKMVYRPEDVICGNEKPGAITPR